MPTREATDRDLLAAKLKLLRKPKPLGLAEYVESTVNWQLHPWQIGLCKILERCEHERSLRILIHAPPQFGKSCIVSQRFPAWLLQRQPTKRIALACYNAEHATRFGEVVRSLLAERGLVKADAPAGHFSTVQRSRLRDAQASFSALGLQTGFTGKGVDELLVDDPYASAEDAKSETINEKAWRWWSETAKPRLNDYTNVIFMYHRYHDDDIAARLAAGGGWENYRFPAISDDGPNDPTNRSKGELLSPMRSREWLEAFEAEDPQTFYSQFQGVPRAAGSELFTRDSLKVVSFIPDIRQWVRYWDFATSEKDAADYTAGALVGLGQNGEIYIRDVVRWRAEWPESRRRILEVAAMDKEIPGTVTAFEKAGMQLALIQDVFPQVPTSVTFTEPKGDKKQRASVWASRGPLGKLALCPGLWHNDFISECLSFPLGKHDDQVDAVSGAVNVIYRSLGGHDKNKQGDKPGLGSPAFMEQYMKIIGGDNAY